MSKENERSLEERMGACPIHQWVDINGYLEEVKVPPSLWMPFHELVVARGLYPKVISQDQAKAFAGQATFLMTTYEVTPADGQGLYMMFTQLIGQWLGAGAEAN